MPGPKPINSAIVARKFSKNQLKIEKKLVREYMISDIARIVNGYLEDLSRQEGLTIWKVSCKQKKVVRSLNRRGFRCTV